jgi:phosphoesterase RecJ-like protein
MINNFNYIEELLVWVTITEDSKNDTIRVSIRSRGPEINAIAEKYNGGGHKYASGLRINNIIDSEEIINELDRACQEYLNMKVGEKNSENQ